jgi:MarR family transcriptional regulator, transcriptional regulator for hemolysin
MINGNKEAVGALLHDVAHLLRTVMDREALPHKLTRAQWHTLEILEKTDGLTQAELAERLELGNPTVGRLIDRLEKRGFVERRADPADRRTKRVYMQAQTVVPVLGELREKADEVRDEVLNGLSRDEQNQLASVLKSIKSNLSGIRARMCVPVVAWEPATGYVALLL